MGQRCLEVLEINACYSTLPQCKMASYTGVTYHTTLTLTSHQKLFHKKILMSGVGLQAHELSVSEEGHIKSAVLSKCKTV